ncbi:MAG: PAS domain-containing protein [Burkholderiaceae bacterium]|nr:MAG: PAS domain-containing protein [Burkholderiaceae bacterium]
MATSKATEKTNASSADSNAGREVKAATETQETGKFPIVALGASAGGLEAFEQFFSHLPADTGMAFVLVQHLDPNHPSILGEILQRCTSLPILEVQDQMKVVPNHVYVIPPNRDMVIFQGTLQLHLPDQPRGHRMPIDGFMRSLAEDQGEEAIGIILSGTGTDGTQGLRSILGAGGIALVQEPATAKYDGMPASAIKAGYATHVMPAGNMPEALQKGVRRLTRHDDGTPAAPSSVNSMNRILMHLRRVTGNDFSQYKKSTIGRRIERRMLQHNLESMEDYARYLKEQPAEVHKLFQEVLINVTSFFRDAEAFELLRREILPAQIKDKSADAVFRIWVAGCATGEEAYSIAMLLREAMDEAQHELKVQMYATDLDEDAIAIARTGVYSFSIGQDISPERLRRFFIKEDAVGYRVKKEIREMVVFAVQNVIKDPPFTRLDLLACRNLMIYLEPDLQERLIATFHYAIKRGGVLFLSPSESIGNPMGMFTALDRKWKFYKTIDSAPATRTLTAGKLPLPLPLPTTHKIPEELAPRMKENNFAEFARRLLLQSFAPASVVTDLAGNILYVHGETGKYLRPAPGKATFDVVEMAREGLQLELREALRNAASQEMPVLNREVTVKTNDDFQTMSFSIRPLQGLSENQHLLVISFQEVPHPVVKKPASRRSRAAAGSVASAETRRIEALEHELGYTKENLQAIVEEQQASNEELKSTNEEMQSTNEELQSTNEELETSKEELQSINEELITVNAELQNKIEEMARMQNDMKNLLDNIHFGTIFLNRNMVVRRFTRDATRVYRLVESDVGRPLGDIKSDLHYEDLLTDAQTVLDTLVPMEREVGGPSGSWYLVRIQPYRTMDNVIDGVVLTFADITERLAHAAARKVLELAKGIVDTIREPLLVLNGDLDVVSASPSFYSAFKVSAEETLGRRIYDLGNRQWDIPDLRELLENILPHQQSFEDYAVVYDFPIVGPRRLLLNARRLVDITGNNELILLAMKDVASQ